MKPITLYFLALLAILPARADESSAPARPPAAKREIIYPQVSQWHGDWSEAGGPEVVVCQNDEAWGKAWQRVRRDVPAHLRTDQLGVAIFIGARSSPGHSVEVVAVEIIDGNYVVTYKEKTPDPGGMYAAVMTSPWVIAILPHTDLPIQVIKAGSAESSSTNAPAR